MRHIGIGLVALILVWNVSGCGSDSSEDGFSEFGVSACVVVVSDGGETCDTDADPHVLDLGTITPGEGASGRVRVSNTGNIDAEISGVSIDSDTFEVTATAAGEEAKLPLTLAPQGEAEITITLLPGQPTGDLPASQAVISVSSGEAHSEAIKIEIAGAVSDCAEGEANCDEDPVNGCETDTTSSVDHCGGCTQACTAENGTMACEESACVATCEDGWEGDTCADDIDECAAETSPCDPNATCENSEGAHTCTCNSGYDGDGVTCSDIDECAANASPCQANSTCSNSDGAYECPCNDGYVLDDDGACSDVDECGDACICLPTCPNKGCGFDDGCGGICGCAQGEACSNGVCIEEKGLAGDTCAAPFIITELPYVDNNNNGAYTHKYAACLDGDPNAGVVSPDVVYAYTATSVIQLSIAVKGEDGGGAKNATLLSWDVSCPMGNNSCQTKDFYQEGLKTKSPILFCTEKGTTYYFIVDSLAPTEVGAYQLHVQKGEQACGVNTEK